MGIDSRRLYWSCGLGRFVKSVCNLAVYSVLHTVSTPYAVLRSTLYSIVSMWRMTGAPAAHLCPATATHQVVIPVCHPAAVVQDKAPCGSPPSSVGKVGRRGWPREKQEWKEREDRGLDLPCWSGLSFLAAFLCFFARLVFLRLPLLFSFLDPHRTAFPLFYFSLQAICACAFPRLAPVLAHDNKPYLKVGFWRLCR
jgi:hypothetical protein